MCLRIGRRDLIDDAQQEATFGLIAAYRKFDESRNVKFNTFARYSVMAAVTEYFRSTKVVPRPDRFYSHPIMIGLDDIGEDERHGKGHDTAASEDDADWAYAQNRQPDEMSVASAYSTGMQDRLDLEESLGQAENIERGLAQLPWRTAFIIVESFLHGRMLGAIAIDMHMSEPWVSLTRRTGLAQLRVLMVQ